ncbi:MAG: D-ribitol-5-phosphate cytidylyltransferase [Brevinema sp.]
MIRKNIAIILAGGSGSRTGLNSPKQFLKLAGKTVLEHTAEAFEKSKDIDEIAIVASLEYHDYIQELMQRSQITKLKKILCNGLERYHSTLSAIKAYEDQAHHVNLIIHDAVRPLVSSRIINDCVRALEKYDAVDTAIPSVDTIIETDNKHIIDIPIRSRFWKGQTPQCFKLDILKQAYDRALSDPEFETTDDCKTVHKYCPEITIHIVAGDEHNIKLTYVEDIYILDRLFQLRSEETSTQPQLSLKALKDKTIVLFGGTEGIGKSIHDLALKYGANTHAFSRRNGVDITNIEDVRNALMSIKTPIDSVIITSGILKKEALETMSYEDILNVINTNFTGNIICAKEAYPYLKKTTGSLLFFTSSSYTRGRSFYAPYSASKAAIVNLTQALAEEWHHDGIRVNCINPERTLTPMRTKAFGIEDPSTLLNSEDVALSSLNTILQNFSGQIIDIKRKKNEQH